jgi:hypothetical protein
MEQNDFIKQALHDTKVQRVVIPCILVATKLLATPAQQKRLEAALLGICDNFIENLLNKLENEKV